MTLHNGQNHQNWIIFRMTLKSPFLLTVQWHVDRHFCSLCSKQLYYKFVVINDPILVIFAHCALEMGMAEKILFCSKWKTIYSRVRCPFPHHHVPPLQHSYSHSHSKPDVHLNESTHNDQSLTEGGVHFPDFDHHFFATENRLHSWIFTQFLMTSIWEFWGYVI